MDLNMAIGEKVSHIQNNVSNYNLQVQPIHINLNFSIYSIVPLVHKLTPVDFIPLGASTGTYTTLESQGF